MKNNNNNKCRQPKETKFVCKSGFGCGIFMIHLVNTFRTILMICAKRFPLCLLVVSSRCVYFLCHTKDHMRKLKPFIEISHAIRQKIYIENYYILSFNDNKASFSCIIAHSLWIHCLIYVINYTARNATKNIACSIMRVKEKKTRIFFLSNNKNNGNKQGLSNK